MASSIPKLPSLCLPDEKPKPSSHDSESSQARQDLDKRPTRRVKRSQSRSRPSILVQEAADASSDSSGEEPSSGHLSSFHSASLRRRSSMQDINVSLGPPKFLPVRRRNEQRSERRQLARNRLRNAFRLALLVVQWLKYVYHRAGENILSLMSVSQQADQGGLIDGQELLFDPQSFRAQREGRLPADARRILQTPSQERQLKDVRYLRIALRNLKEFRGYPVTIQQRVCNVAWYEGYGPKRAIIRQGHVPFTFYMILSGSVVVTVKDEKSDTSKTVCFLHPGMAFGELGIITRSRRMATIVSKSAVELLCISAEDFEEIFMAGGLKIWEDPITLRLMREVNCLREWPVHVMKDHPADCMFQFFPRGQVLASDSLVSDWIYIVRSGSLSVFRKLVDRRRSPPHSHQGRAPIRLPRLPGTNRVTNPEFRRLAGNRRVPKKGLTGPQPSEKFGSRAELELALEKRVPGFVNRDDRLGLVDYARLFERHAYKLRPQNPADASQRNRRLWRRGVHLALEEQDGRRTITGTFHRPVSPLGDCEEATFVRLRILERGQYFGVTSMVFADQPSLILLSNGAECLMISRKLFLRFASENCLRQLRRTEVPYPCADELASKLHNFRAWQGTKRRLFSETLRELETQREVARH